jgi:hypothetical protein
LRDLLHAARPVPADIGDHWIAASFVAALTNSVRATWSTAGTSIAVGNEFAK